MTDGGNVGGDDNLAVIIGAYTNDVQCRGPFEGWKSCREMLEEIPAGKTKEVFGVDVKLPYQLNSREIIIFPLFPTPY